MRDIVKAVGAAVGALTVAPALAADLPTKKPAPPPPPVVAPSPWRFEVIGYGWGVSLGGYAGIRNFPTSSYYVNFFKVLQHLDGAVFGAATASNGTFLIGVDLIWARLGFTSTFKNPNSPLFGTQADLTLNEGIVTGLGGVRIPIGPPLYGIAGARRYGTSDSLTLTTPVFGFERSASLYKDWADPVGGLTAKYTIDPKWFVNTEADIGGWSNTSATGQALAAVGYNWTQNIATTLGYRVLYTYDKQDTGDTRITAANTSFRFQQWMHGPFVALKYSF